MPRTFKNITNKDFPEEDLKRTVKDVLNGVGSIRVVATGRNMTKSRLNNYVQKKKEVGLYNINFKPIFTQRQMKWKQSLKIIC